jgi:hypothetical protein
MICRARVRTKDPLGRDFDDEEESTFIIGIVYFNDCSLDSIGIG